MCCSKWVYTYKGLTQAPKKQNMTRKKRRKKMRGFGRGKFLLRQNREVKDTHPRLGLLLPLHYGKWGFFNSTSSFIKCDTNFCYYNLNKLGKKAKKSSKNIG